MGRRSKSEKAIEKIIKIKREPGFFTVVIKKGDTIVFSTKRISKIDLTKVYLKNLGENISKHPEFTSKDILNAYKQLWSKYTISSTYTDSYGHRWTKGSFLSDSWLLKFTDNVLETRKK